MPDPSGWWMYHGDPAHTGLAAGSTLTSDTVPNLQTLYTLALDGPVLSVPAVTGGFVYVGLANSHAAVGSNGGAFHKISLASGEIVATFNWDIPLDERDAHGFTGMGCTPTVIGGSVYFTAFNAKLYCLSADTLALQWVTDLRHADAAHNQPVENTRGMAEGAPPPCGWSSPVVVGDRVYVGIGEGENPLAYSFVYCLDAATGDVVWMLCTCKFETGRDNQPNEIPAAITPDPVPSGYTLFSGEPVALGASVWSSIAYDAGTGRLFCATGNPQFKDKPHDPGLPQPGHTLGDYSYGLLALDAEAGTVEGFTQVTADTNYRASDIDVDFGGSPTIFQLNGQTVVGLGCKNGTYFVFDAETLECLEKRQLLPTMNDGSQIATVDPHSTSSELNPHPTNEESNSVDGENFHGTFSTAAHDGEGRLFVGLGGNNYNTFGPGIDSDTTPFMRAIDDATLADVWATEGDPAKYTTPAPPMYETAGESALSSPAAVNDVVFCSTSKIALYAFRSSDGKLLWSDQLGQQTGGYTGGYGYCMGPAIAGGYVVAGALVFGREGGILRIYGLPDDA